MTRVRHFDALEVRFDRSTLRTNSDSTVTVDGFAAHVGNMTYHDDRGRPFVEHVPASTLFNQRSLDSAAGTTLTIRHGPGLITPDRYRAEAHGTWVKAWDAGDGNLGVRVRLGSDEAIAFVRKAMDAREAVELSPTYEVDVIDTPGDTDEGHHDAVQKDRDYSGLAMLGPNEARGGPGTRLQLDAKTCAPKGCRVQVRRQLDSAASPRISFVSKDRDPMTKAIISSKGRSRAVSLDTLKSIRAQAVPKLDAVNTDQIEVGTLTVEIEGEEPVALTLPVTMIEMMLEGIGAGSAAAPAELPEEEIAVEQAEGLDAEDDEEKTDSNLARVVAREVKVQIDAMNRKRQTLDALTATINHDAGRILPPGYDYSVGWRQTALDAIAKASPELEARAKQLVTKSRNGDAMASGALTEMLRARAVESGQGVQIQNVEGAKPKLDSSPSNPTPPHERPRPTGGDS